MPQKHRKFSPQFKAEAVQMVIETGKPVAEVARKLGVNDASARLSQGLRILRLNDNS